MTQMIPRNIFLTASMVALSAGSGLAQEADLVIEEITVTARRIEERVQDVPGTVNVISASEIKSAGIQRAEDFIRLTPGVSLVDTAEVGDTQINIRGINATRDAEASFAFLVDGILYSNPSSFNREFANLQQIEVLKGPQGAIYGRNAAAGAIIVTTNRPGDEFEADLTVQGGNNSLIVGRGAMSGPVIEDVLFASVAFDFRSTDGFFTNEFLGEDVVDDYQGYNLNSRWIYQPSDNFTLDLKTRYGEVDAAAITFNSIFHLPAFTFASPAFAEDVNDHEFRFLGNIDPQNDQRTIEVSTKADWEFDFATLTAWFLYSDVDQSFSSDGTSAAFNFFVGSDQCRDTTAQLNAAGVVLPAPQILGEVPDPLFGGVPNGSVFGAYTPTACDGTQFQLRDQRDYSFEVRLSSPGDQRFRWQGGAYFLNIDRQVAVNLGIDDGFGVIERPFVPSGQPNATEQLLFDQFDNRVFAVFGSAQYDVTDRFEVSAALRYDNERREVESLVPTEARTQFVDFDGDFVFAGGAPLNPGLDPTLNPSGVLGADEETFTQIQPKISLTYDFSDNATVFASWGIGFKSGGFNNTGSAATVNVFINDAIGLSGEDRVNISDTFREETSSAFEIGLKSNWFSNRIGLEGAFYYTDVEDLQFFEFFVGPFGLLRVVSNIDEVRIFGFEVGARAEIVDGLDLNLGFNFTDSEIQENSSRPTTVGNESPATPDWTLSASLQYVRPIVDEYEGLLRVDANAVGPTFFHTVQDQFTNTIFGAPADNSLTERDTLVTVNLRAGVQTERWSLVGFVQNLMEEEFLAEVINAPEFGGSFAAPGDRRTFGGEFTFRF